MVSFLEKWIEADCGENHRPLSQVAESRWILLANIFSAHGVPIGEESQRWRVVARLFLFTSQITGHRIRPSISLGEAPFETITTKCLREKIVSPSSRTSKI